MLRYTLISKVLLESMGCSQRTVEEHTCDLSARSADSTLQDLQEEIRERLGLDASTSYVDTFGPEMVGVDDIELSSYGDAPVERIRYLIAEDSLYWEPPRSAYPKKAAPSLKLRHIAALTDIVASRSSGPDKSNTTSSNTSTNTATSSSSSKPPLLTVEALDATKILSENRPFGIFCKTLRGRTITLRVQPKMTIKDIKQLVQDSEGVPVDQQHVMWQGKLLDDDPLLHGNGRPLLAWELGRDTTLYLCMRLRAGMHHGTSGRLDNQPIADAKAEANKTNPRAEPNKTNPKAEANKTNPKPESVSATKSDPQPVAEASPKGEAKSKANKTNPKAEAQARSESVHAEESREAEPRHVKHQESPAPTIYSQVTVVVPSGQEVVLHVPISAGFTVVPAKQLMQAALKQAAAEAAGGPMLAGPASSAGPQPMASAAGLAGLHATKPGGSNGGSRGHSRSQNTQPRVTC